MGEEDPIPPRSLTDAVLAVHDRNPERARVWLTAESITARKRQGESKGADPRALLLKWVEDQLAAAYRMTSPMFYSHEGETQEQRQSREAAERAYYDREETSVQRAQNFGKRLAARDDESIRVPRSYSMNRGLVLGSHKKDHPGRRRPRDVTAKEQSTLHALTVEHLSAAGVLL